MTIFLIAVFIMLLWGVFSFNSLNAQRQSIIESWADIDVQLKRRYDLIPNLVNTVKGYAAHESGVFEKVTEARAAAMSAGRRRNFGGGARAVAAEWPLGVWLWNEGT